MDQDSKYCLRVVGSGFVFADYVSDIPGSKHCLIQAFNIARPLGGSARDEM